MSDVRDCQLARKYQCYCITLGIVNYLLQQPSFCLCSAEALHFVCVTRVIYCIFIKLDPLPSMNNSSSELCTA